MPKKAMKEKRTISPKKKNPGAYHVSDGLTNRGWNHFATVKEFVKEEDRFKLGNWKTCREDFAKSWKDHKFIVFSHKKGANKGSNTSYSIAIFIRMAEERIRGKGRWRRTQVGPTEYANISWIKLSQFWMNDKMRKSFFTILLRASRHFNSQADDLEKEFERALFSDDQGYFKNTKPAVERFMKGFTKYTGTKAMWYSAMYYDTSVYNSDTTAETMPVRGKRLTKLLVKP